MTQTRQRGKAQEEDEPPRFHFSTLLPLSKSHVTQILPLSPYHFHSDEEPNP